MKYTTPTILTVDAVLLTIADDELHVALHKRDHSPFQGHWALPGGYIHNATDDSAKAAVARVLHDKLQVQSPYLEEFGTFSGPVRDPRGWSLTVVYYALVPALAESARVQLFAVNQLPNLPFDHTHIIDSVVATPLCPCICARPNSPSPSCTLLTKPCWAKNSISPTFAASWMIWLS
jgi:8-oxo-dGTP diphosphatase